MKKPGLLFLLPLFLLPALLLRPEPPVHFDTVLAADTHALSGLYTRYRSVFTSNWFSQSITALYALHRRDAAKARLGSDRILRLARLEGGVANIAALLYTRADLLRQHNWASPAVIRSCLKEAITSYDKANNEHWAGKAALLLGHLDLHEKKLDAANLAYFDALARFRRLALWKDLSDAAVALGRLRLLQNNPAEAEGFFRVALRHAYQGKSNTRKGSARVGIGDAAMRKHLYEKAQEYYRKALRDYGADITPWNAGVINQRLGRAFNAAADFSRAADAYQKALIWYRKGNHTPQVIRTISSLGNALHLSSRIEEARNTFLYGMQMLKTSDNKNDRGDLLSAYASFCYWTGAYDLALKKSREARVLYNSTGNTLGSANIDQLTAYVAGALGRRSWQKAMLRRALTTYRKINIPINTANTLTLLADMAIKENSLDEALKLLSEALTLYKRNNAILGEANIYNTFSFVHLLKKEYPDTLRFAERAARIYKQMGNHNNLGNTFYNRSRVFSLTGKHEQALAMIKEADRLYEAAGNKENRINALRFLFESLTALKRHQEAGRILEQNLRLILDLRQQSGSERMRLHYQEKTGSIVKEMILTTAKSAPEYGLKLLDQFLGRTFLENLQGRRALRAAGIPEETIKTWQTLQHALAAARITLQKISPGTDDATRKRKQTARQALNKARTAAETMENALASSYPRYARLRRPVITTLDTTRKQLAADEALVVYSLIGTRLGIWTVTRDKPVTFTETVFTTKDTTLATAYLQELTQQKSGTTARTGLVNRILSPVLTHLPATPGRLNIIPDGVLGILPWTHLAEALPGAKRPRSIVIHPSVTLFTTLRQEENSLRTVPPLPILVFGGARYQQDVDPGLTNSASLSPTKRSSLLHASRGDTPDEQWDNLPGTIQEGQDICRIWYRGQVSRQRAAFFYDLLASEASIKSLNSGIRFGDATLRLADARILHFAVHGKADQNAAETSRLILTSKKALSAAEISTLKKWFPAFPAEDGNLNAAEILALDINADLVILSACQTGIGKISTTEGILGLTRSWFIAGARGVLVSLWNVSDVGTRIFMTLFHQRLAAGDGPDTALNTVTGLLRSGKWRSGDFAPDKTFTARGYQVAYSSLDLSSPYFWAAFQYWGR